MVCTRFLGLIGPHQHHDAAHAGQDVLRRFAVLDHGVDSGRLQQTAHHHRLGLFVRVENLYQFLVILCWLCHGCLHEFDANGSSRRLQVVLFPG